MIHVGSGITEGPKLSFQSRPNVAMALMWTWFSYLAFLAANAILHDPSSSGSGAFSLTTLLLHWIVTTVGFSLWLCAPIATALSIGLLFRIGLILASSVGSVSLPFLGDGGDAEGFYYSAIRVSEDLSLAGSTYGGNYTGLLGTVFHFIGPDRIQGQYLNSLFSISAVLILAKILMLLRVENRIVTPTIFVAALMPGVAIQSSAFLREAPIQFLVTASLLFFIRGILARRIVETLLAFALVLAASTLHSGVVILAFGYGIALSLFDCSDGKTIRRVRFRIAPAIVFGAAFLVVVVGNPELFLGKFDQFDSLDELYDSSNRRAGGSAYLAGVEVSSPITLILYGPIRAAYLLASPMPWDWRGFNDFLAFSLDSIVYVFVVLGILRSRNLEPQDRDVRNLFLAILVPVIMVFGAGVSNSGTAMRHRTKLTMLLLVAGAYVYDRRLKRNVGRLR